MKEELPDSYLNNPDKYCESISILIQNGSDEWQTVWRSAIKEIFQNTELFQHPVNNINAINSLLKVIEKAFKERVYRLRVQAFECWQYFIVIIDTNEVSDKLLNVLLIPLSASNHSVFEVLRAKLRTWASLLDSSLILRPAIMKKGIPSLLKILYGPHALRSACEFDDLVEICGNIYLKMLEKCGAYETIDAILGSLERAIPVLAKDENTLLIADLIWTKTLEHISNNNWPASQFNYLIKTLQNLISLNNSGANTLIDSFLTLLLETYCSFPVGYLKLNMALFSRCLFHVPQKNILNLMERLMKKLQNENLFFNEIIKTWHAFVEEYKNELYKYWVAVKTCFLSWKTRDEASDSTWVLLLPIKHLHDKWDVALLNQIRSVYNEVFPSTNADSFIKALCNRLAEFISESENLSVSFLNATIEFCKIILQSPKRSDGIRHVKLILHALYQKFPSQEVFMNSTYKNFAPKFIAAVLFFLKEFPDCANELSSITQLCNSFISDEKINLNEFPVVQLIKKFNNEDEGITESVLRPHNVIGAPAGAKTGSTLNHLKTSFLGRLSSSTEKKKTNSETIIKTPSTPKLVKETDEDNDVQFIAIKSRPKNSPLTEHQKEKAKANNHIPALYEDLSQSQSQSQSESVSLLSNKIATSVISGIEYFEEDANLPPEKNGERDNVENTPSTDLTSVSSSINSNSGKKFTHSSKKSLFKDKTNAEDKIMPSTNLKTSVNSEFCETVCPNEVNEETENNEAKSESSTGKRRSTRSVSVTEPAPSKRSKRMSENLVTSNQNKSSVDQKEIEEKKIRGRPKKSDTANVCEKVLIVDSESQNLFVSSPVHADKSSAASIPVASLINSKNSEDIPKTRRKSLKSKSSLLPTRSPIATRKRKSLTIENFTVKKALNINNINSDENLSTPVVTEEKSADISSKNDVIEAAVTSMKPKSSIIADDSLDMNNSVIIVESNLRNDVISIIDSESEDVAKNIETEAEGSKTASLDVPDESTFFEEAEGQKKNKDISVEKCIENNKEKTNEVIGADKCKKHSLNESFPENLILEETQIEKSCENIEIHERDANSPRNVEKHNENQPPSEIGSPEKSPVKEASSPIKNKITTTERNEEISKKDTHSPQKSVATKSDITGDNPDLLAGKKKLIDENVGSKIENQIISNEQPKTNTSPMSNNTRTLKIMKMACDSQILPKPKNFGKTSRSPLSSSIVASSSRTSTNQRTMKILMANSGSAEKPRTSPNKVISSVTERMKYYPKECTSPGILKKPDLNGSFSSPKSAKFVNFAEQLTLTRTFDINEENYSDSYSSDDQSNSNIINDDEATSQEVLYSPLLNCSDDVKNIIDRLSLSKTAVDLFHRMGIKTVGNLASISTLTAKSIPAGDNRLQRLRKALKDYDEWRTSFYKSKGLRIPSARRRILCKVPQSIFEVSSLIELLDEAESSKTSSKENEFAEVVNNKLMPTVVIAKLSEENCPSLVNKDEIMTKLEGHSSPTKNSRTEDVKSPSPEINADAVSVSVNESATVSIDDVSTCDTIDVPVNVSDSPKKSSEDSVGVESCADEELTTAAAEQISTENEVSAALVENILAGNDVRSAAQQVTENLVSEEDCIVPDCNTQAEINEDTDLVYTASDESSKKTDELTTNPKKAATCEYIASLRSPLVLNSVPVMTASPEIITVELNDNEEPSERENSMSIFSPDVTSRTVNGEMGTPSECVSQSVIEASKNQITERTVFNIDETVPDKGVKIVESDRSDEDTVCGTFSELLSNLWEPFLTDRLKRLMIPDENTATAEYCKIMRCHVMKVRELYDAGLISYEKLRECGLDD